MLNLLYDNEDSKSPSIPLVALFDVVIDDILLLGGESIHYPDHQYAEDEEQAMAF